MKRLAEAGCLVLLLAISAPQASSAATATTLKSLFLQPSDVPTFSQSYGHYTTNEELARITHVSVAKVVQQGRLLSYETLFGKNDLSGIFDVNGEVVAFTSAAGAQAELAAIVVGVRQAVSKNRNYQELRRLDLGDQAVGFTYETDLNAQSITTDILVFQRGSYRADLEVDFVTGAITADDGLKQALELAKIADSRIQAASGVAEYLGPIGSHRVSKSVSVYKTSWRHGLKGWNTGGEKGFKTAKGILTYNGKGNTGIVAPFKTKGLGAFAVQAKIKNEALTRNGQPHAGGFGIFVHKSASQARSGIGGGIIAGPGPQLIWGVDSTGGNAFSPGSKSYHTYRIEVHADRYQLFIDGKEKVSLRIEDYRSLNQVGIFSAFYKISVKDFRVLRLK